MGKLRLQITNQLNNSGQVLIEVLVALGVIVVVISTITISTATSLSNVQFSKNHNQATQFAQEAMEALRSVRSTNLATFTAMNGIYCLPGNSKTFSQASSCSVNVQNFFKRTVTIEKNNIPICSGGTKATVVVAWTDGKCTSNVYCHNATIASCLAVTNVSSGL